MGDSKLNGSWLSLHDVIIDQAFHDLLFSPKTKGTRDSDDLGSADSGLEEIHF